MAISMLTTSTVPSHLAFHTEKSDFTLHSVSLQKLNEIDTLLHRSDSSSPMKPMLATSKRTYITRRSQKKTKNSLNPGWILKLASGTHTKWILNRDKKNTMKFIKKAKKLLQRQNIHSQMNSRFTPATNLKIGTFVLIPNFVIQKGISKKLQPIRKAPFPINEKPTDVTYNFFDSNEKEFIQHRNNLLPYYPKEYALRELIQLYSFTSFKTVHNN